MSDKNFFIGLILGGIIGYLIAKRLVIEDKERIREIYKPLEHTCRW